MGAISSEKGVNCIAILTRDIIAWVNKLEDPNVVNCGVAPVNHAARSWRSAAIPMKDCVDAIRRVHLLWASRMECVCSGVAKKLCRPLMSISISGLKANSGSGEQISEQLCCDVEGTGDLSGPAMEMKTFHVLSYESSDKGHKEVIECSHLCEVSSL